MFKIEALTNGQWRDDVIGDPNTFDSEEEALSMVPELARVFESPETEFRVVEV